MTTLSDLERIVPDIISRLEQIRRNMSRYKKLETDYRGKTLMREIEAKIDVIKKVYEVYKTAPSYKTKNFDNWVAKEEHYVKECTAIYKKIMEYESVTGYN